jgi:hypothetical protein
MTDPTGRTVLAGKQSDMTIGSAVNEGRAYGLVGRERELERLVSALGDGGPVVTFVHGAPGVGRCDGKCTEHDPDNCRGASQCNQRRPTADPYDVSLGAAEGIVVVAGRRSRERGFKLRMGGVWSMGGGGDKSWTV